MVGEIDSVSQLPSNRSCIFRTTNSDWDGALPSKYTPYARFRSSHFGAYSFWLGVDADQAMWFARPVPEDGIPILNDWRKVAVATPPQEFDLPLADGIIHYNPSTKSTYSKSQEGLVIVHFYCKKFDGTDIVPGDTIAMLPEGFRPSANVHIPANISFTGDSVYSQDVAVAVADPTGRVWIAFPPAGCKAVTTTLVFYAAS